MKKGNFPNPIPSANHALIFPHFVPIPIKTTPTKDDSKYGRATTTLAQLKIRKTLSDLVAFFVPEFSQRVLGKTHSEFPLTKFNSKTKSFALLKILPCARIFQKKKNQEIGYDFETKSSVFFAEKFGGRVLDKLLRFFRGKALKEDRDLTKQDKAKPAFCCKCLKLRTNSAVSKKSCRHRIDLKQRNQKEKAACKIDECR